MCFRRCKTTPSFVAENHVYEDTTYLDNSRQYTTLKDVNSSPYELATSIGGLNANAAAVDENVYAAINENDV
ncbi:hypothetical protein DPMN_173574 [Dreissena polymorpha]|uniref:Uncharacterized protein n=1 Tax=Dreissena polymorpha TaxID=45954 RepID=A0A9D4IEB7_DREPO|nr:hypothetical protein DPMN_173574 [Dreissena polymorpha]